jgi:putative addiction module component (TIGR02574 family)
MSVAKLLSAAKKLPFDERVELAQQVWSNIVDNGYESELTPEQIEELERRAEETVKHPERCIPWEQVRSELKKRLAQRRK